MRDRAYRGRAVGMLVLLGVQFAVGMLLNLFVALPERHPGSTGGEYFSRSWQSLVWSLSLRGGWALFLHALIGTIVAVALVVMSVAALVQRARGWRWALGVAALFGLGAFFNGMSFVDYGEDLSSAIMAGCWLGAVAAIVVGILVNSRPRGRTGRARQGMPVESHHQH